MAKRKRHQKKQAKSSEGMSVPGFLEWLDKEFQARQKNPHPPYPYNQEEKTIELPKKIEDELVALLRDDQKVEAIKRVTKLTGAGLRISKDYVDELQSRL